MFASAAGDIRGAGIGGYATTAAPEVPCVKVDVPGPAAKKKQKRQKAAVGELDLFGSGDEEEEIEEMSDDEMKGIPAEQREEERERRRQLKATAGKLPGGSSSGSGSAPSPALGNVQLAQLQGQTHGVDPSQQNMLAAIGGMLDTKLNPVNQEITEVKVRLDKNESRMDGLEKRMIMKPRSRVPGPGGPLDISVAVGGSGLNLARAHDGRTRCEP